jgi:hypothetical protein
MNRCPIWVAVLLVVAVQMFLVLRRAARRQPATARLMVGSGSDSASRRTRTAQGYGRRRRRRAFSRAFFRSYSREHSRQRRCWIRRPVTGERYG